MALFVVTMAAAEVGWHWPSCCCCSAGRGDVDLQAARDLGEPRESVTHRIERR